MEEKKPRWLLHPEEGRYKGAFWSSCHGRLGDGVGQPHLGCPQLLGGPLFLGLVSSAEGKPFQPFEESLS